MKYGRRQPYTAAGIGRTKCFRCNAKAESQWRACADGMWRPLCRKCDIALNRLVLRWMGDKDVARKMKGYK